MIFQDNVIKEYLKNVYFVSGTPCGGKTTLSKALSRRFGLPVYNIDEMFDTHRSMSDAVSQPNMNKTFRDADEFFSRTVEEYMSWLIGSTREQLDFVLLDLMRLSRDEKIICDCHITLEQAKKLTEPSRAVFMIKEPVDIAQEYCSRPDHKDYSDFVNSASDPEKAKALCSETLFRLNSDLYDNVRKSEWLCFDRADGFSVEYTVNKTASRFGLFAPDSVTIVKVEKGTGLARELVSFVENCSWDEVKEHLAEGFRRWEFAENEAVFAAVSDGGIVGVTTLMNTDYYPLPEIFPWVSCVFVSEGYRGRRISETLIGAANRHAASLGYKRTYIPSPFMGLYEKYGYRYLKDIVNYGGDTDHLFAKEL